MSIEMNENTEQTTEVRERDVVDDNGNSVRRQAVSVRDDSTADQRVVASRVVWYIAGAIIAVLALRILLYLLAANQGSPFVDFIYGLSAIFAAPFYGIFAQPAYGASVFDTASLVAIAVYALIAWGLTKLFTINRPAGSTDV